MAFLFDYYGWWAMEYMLWPAELSIEVKLLMPMLDGPLAPALPFYTNA